MNNLEAIKLWNAWLEENEQYPGDVTAATEPEVDFWFANNGEEANRFFHCFASGGDGSLVAVYSAKGGAFESGPVVHLGHEGDVFVVADGVPAALALFAASGDSYEQAIYDDEEARIDADAATWVTKTFNVKVAKSVAGAVKAAGKANGEEAIKKHIATLNDG